jgi:hypothetical protein
VRATVKWRRVQSEALRYNAVLLLRSLLLLSSIGLNTSYISDVSTEHNFIYDGVFACVRVLGGGGVAVFRRIKNALPREYTVSCEQNIVLTSCYFVRRLGVTKTAAFRKLLLILRCPASYNTHKMYEAPSPPPNGLT